MPSADSEPIWFPACAIETPWHRARWREHNQMDKVTKASNDKTLAMLDLQAQQRLDLDTALAHTMKTELLTLKDEEAGAMEALFSGTVEKVRSQKLEIHMRHLRKRCVHPGPKLKHTTKLHQPRCFV